MSAPTRRAGWEHGCALVVGGFSPLAFALCLGCKAFAVLMRLLSQSKPTDVRPWAFGAHQPAESFALRAVLTDPASGQVVWAEQFPELTLSCAQRDTTPLPPLLRRFRAVALPQLLN